MTLNANALTSLATAKAYLKVPTAVVDQDTIIELLINSASAYIERETNRQLYAASVSEIRSGRKQNILLLKEWPVNSITSLHIDRASVFGSDTLVDSSDYTIGDDNNSLIYLNQVFPNGYANIRVVYNAGYATIPSDLEHACLWLVSWYYTTRDGKDIGRPRRGKGDESTEILQKAPDDVRDCIMRYKRTEVLVGDSLTYNS